MNYDNYSDEGSCLNAVNITSNVRAPGEYKYYYCGENNSSSDKSFLSISTIGFSLYFISKGIRYSLINKSNNKNDKRANFSF